MKKPYLLSLVAVIISFLCGMVIGTDSFNGAMKGSALVIQEVQKETDELSKLNPDALAGIAAVSNDDERGKLVTSALLGANREINPSNVIFFSVSTNLVENGMLRDWLGRRLIFRVVAADDRAFSTNHRPRILVGPGSSPKAGIERAR